jgi:hypothetical protein
MIIALLCSDHVMTCNLRVLMTRHFTLGDGLSFGIRHGPLKCNFFFGD